MSHPHAKPQRAAVISTLARATTVELAGALAAHWPDIAYSELKPTEIGLVMLRGRIGGDGAPFNLGEATVARAVVALATGEQGHGQVLGRDKAKARLAAVFDALAQRPADAPLVERYVLAPVRARLAADRRLSAEQSAATKVDFFTLVRGED